MSLKISGLEKLSTIDYPDKLACVIFLKGCNFSCGFCYNKELVVPEFFNTRKDMLESEIHYFLDRRKGQLEAVVLTGGEPTIYGQELIDFIKKIKEKGYLVKLDTNGSNPEVLEKIVSQNLVDYIAMDLKDDFDNYSEYTAVPVENIKRSFEIVKNAKTPHEFRITTHPDLTLSAFNKLVDLAKGHKIYVQEFVNENTIKSYKNYKTIYSKLSKSDSRYILRD
ncbi:MAG TPA: anaerobic ribonucleoside-triphosphate reductase activating protein [archaeon]|nr:anaerobic ribonucleoside-triphosphate reductase activating protein [archaeon]HPV66063.1 anaerobic ribonucleoside-triphosphate reductase activating protein [archaeon]